MDSPYARPSIPKNLTPTVMPPSQRIIPSDLAIRRVAPPYEYLAKQPLPGPSSPRARGYYPTLLHHPLTPYPEEKPPQSSRTAPPQRGSRFSVSWTIVRKGRGVGWTVFGFFTKSPLPAGEGDRGKGAISTLTAAASTTSPCPADHPLSPLADSPPYKGEQNFLKQHVTLIPA